MGIILSLSDLVRNFMNYNFMDQIILSKNKKMKKLFIEIPLVIKNLISTVHLLMMYGLKKMESDMKEYLKYSIVG
jgi:hypothetical protein